MKYNGRDWAATAKNSLSEEELAGAADKKMTAVYFPYSGSASVSASAGKFVLDGTNYNGYFLVDELASYTYGSQLSGNICLSAPALSSKDKYVHFDITGYTNGHSYVMIQDHVKPIYFNNVSADGKVTYKEGSLGENITGYQDDENSIISFSGLLDASVVGVHSDYQFSVEDLTTNTIYSRYVGAKTLNDSKYIGIGDIRADVWTATSYVDLGLSVKWASYNIGASVPEECGDYFAWGGTETYYEPGYAQSKDPVWKPGKENGYSPVNYPLQGKYNDDISKGTVDNKSVLDPEDDVAHVKLGGNWRMPTWNEWDELMDESNCIWTWTSYKGIYGYRVSSRKPGYTSNSIFLPAAGIRYFYMLQAYQTEGAYASANLNTNSEFARDLLFSSSGYEANGYLRSIGRSIRPVYGPTVFVSGVTLGQESLTLTPGDVIQLKAEVSPSNATNQGLRWCSDNPSVALVTENGKVSALTKGAATISVTTEDGSKTASCTIIVEAMPEPDVVDLGLGVNWASFNLGASVPEECGNFYGWGQRYPDEKYNYETNRWFDGYKTLLKYNTISVNGQVDDKTVLEPEDDAASVNLGGEWRMPTLADWEELVDNCTWKWTSQNGVQGYRITSRKSGYTSRSIFLPATGGIMAEYEQIFTESSNYWSSSLSEDSKSASGLLFNSSKYTVDYTCERTFGLQIRPVCPSSRKISVKSITMNQTSVYLPVGFTEKLDPIVSPSWATDKTLKWSTSDKTVATVTANGVITTVSPGTVTITAKATDGSGVKAICTVNVLAEPLPAAVDLGLSVKWASCSLGASSPEETGDFFAWGETNVKSEYTWNNYIYGNSSSGPFSKYVTKERYGIVDNLTVLEPEDDAATAIFGAGWRLPTKDEFKEIFITLNTTHIETVLNGVHGFKVVSKKSGYKDKWIFLPSTGSTSITYQENVYPGLYWTSSIHSSDSMAEIFYSSLYFVSSSSHYRYIGCNIWPVYDDK